MKKFSSTSGLLIIILGAVILGVLFLKALGLFKPLQSGFLTLTEPIYGSAYSAGHKISGYFGRSTDLVSLQQENEKLRQDNTALKLRVTELEDAEQENIALRQLVDFFEADIGDFPRVVARIIGRDPENPSILLLSVGERDGVEKNNAVIVADGVLIAKITEVFARSSKALLLTDSRSSVAVTVSGGAPTSKVAKGERGLSFLLEQVPQQEIITPGQVVITSGLEPAIPRGLVVGEIEEIISESNDLFQTAVLKPLVDYDESYFVAVILSPTE